MSHSKPKITMKKEKYYLPKLFAMSNNIFPGVANAIPVFYCLSSVWDVVSFPRY